jgi:hypothetical protein
LSACAGNQAQQFAAARIGVVAAGQEYPPQPDECRRSVPDPVVQVGDEARVVILRFKDAKRQESASKRRCFDFNEALR